MALRLCDGSSGVGAPLQRSSLNGGCGGVGAQHRVQQRTWLDSICGGAGGLGDGLCSGLADGLMIFCFSSDLQKQTM